MTNLNLDTPINITLTNSINKLDIEVLELILHKNATLSIRCYNNDELIKHINYTLTETEYNLWGTNDNYIENLVKAKLSILL
jgi:hypothetical protein